MKFYSGFHKPLLLTLILASLHTHVYGMLDSGLLVAVVAGGCCGIYLERRISAVEKDIQYRESNAIFEQEYAEDLTKQEKIIESLRSDIKTHTDNIRGLGRAINMDSENFRIIQANQMALARVSVYRGQPPHLTPLAQLPHVEFSRYRNAQQKSKLQNSSSSSNSLNSEDLDLQDNKILSDDSPKKGVNASPKSAEPIFKPIIARTHLSPAELDMVDMGAQPFALSPGGECQ